MPLVCPAIVRNIIIILCLLPQTALTQSSRLHVAIGNNGYYRDNNEYRQKAKSLLIVNALTWSVQCNWKNDGNYKTNQLLFEHFPTGTYLMYVNYPQAQYNYWKKFTVTPIAESFLGLHRQDTSTLPLDLNKALKNTNDSLKIAVSTISCTEHTLAYIVLKKTAAGIVCRKDTYQVEHGPDAVGLVFICNEPITSSHPVLLSKKRLHELNRALNLSLVVFPGTESSYIYYDFTLGSKHCFTGEREREGPLELYFAGIFR